MSRFPRKAHKDVGPKIRKQEIRKSSSALAKGTTRGFLSAVIELKSSVNWGVQTSLFPFDQVDVAMRTQEMMY